MRARLQEQGVRRSSRVSATPSTAVPSPASAASLSPDVVEWAQCGDCARWRFVPDDRECPGKADTFVCADFGRRCSEDCDSVDVEQACIDPEDGEETGEEGQDGSGDDDWEDSEVVGTDHCCVCGKPAPKRPGERRQLWNVASKHIKDLLKAAGIKTGVPAAGLVHRKHLTEARRIIKRSSQPGAPSLAANKTVAPATSRRGLFTSLNLQNRRLKASLKDLKARIDKGRRKDRSITNKEYKEVLLTRERKRICREAGEPDFVSDVNRAIVDGHVKPSDIFYECVLACRHGLGMDAWMHTWVDEKKYASRYSRYAWHNVCKKSTRGTPACVHATTRMRMYTCACTHAHMLAQAGVGDGNVCLVFEFSRSLLCGFEGGFLPLRRCRVPQPHSRRSVALEAVLARRPRQTYRSSRRRASPTSTKPTISYPSKGAHACLCCRGV